MTFTGLMIGWGFFWLLVWGAVMLLFWAPRSDKELGAVGWAILGLAVSIFWILAWILVRVLG
jgi:hypothetical protein